MTLGIVGCGNMGEAIVRGLLASGREPSSILASHPRPKRREELSRLGVRTTASNAEAAGCEVVLLAVKPVMLEAVAPEIAPATRGKLLISILGGTPVARLSGLLPAARIVRSMPNEPASVRAGMTGLWAPPQVGEEDRRTAGSLFEAVGAVVWLSREELLHALTGVSGCGPAFLYVVAEALADGGVAAGLPRSIAATLAAHTVAGAGRSLVESGLHPAALKDRVASPGGTTIQGLAALEKAAVRSGLIEAVRAAARRSQEVSGETAGSGPPRSRKKGRRR